MINRSLVSILVLLALSGAAVAQSMSRCCIGGFPPEQAAKMEAQRHHVDALLATSRDCRQSHAGCPDGYFTARASGIAMGKCGPYGCVAGDGR
jgi:hypothetical protein